MWRGQLGVKQIVIRGDAEVKFYEDRFPILFLRGVLTVILLTLCFILTDDLQINIFKFVTGHAQRGN